MNRKDPEMTGSYPRYVVVFALVCLCINALMIVVNAYVDPQDRLGHLNLPRLELDRSVTTGGREETASRLLTGSLDALVLGSSRAEVGIDLRNPVFDEYQVYDASLRGTNLYEISRVFEFALDHNELDLVVYGVDFLTFSTRRTVRADFYNSAFHTRSPLAVARYLTSIDSLKSSIRTLAPGPWRQTRQRDSESKFSAGDWDSLDQRELFKQVLVTNFILNPMTYGEFDYGADRLEMFRHILEESAGRGVDLKLFISPIHAWQLETIASMGLLGTYNKWQHDLVDIVKSVNESTNSGYVLWDFSGYNRITTESVPIPGEPQSKMNWYQDASHYRKVVGDLVLSRIIDDRTDSGLAGDFGQVLTPDNMPGYTSSFIEARARYRSSHQGDLEELENLIRMALDQEPAAIEFTDLPSG